MCIKVKIIILDYVVYRSNKYNNNHTVKTQTSWALLDVKSHASIILKRLKQQTFQRYQTILV